MQAAVFRFGLAVLFFLAPLIQAYYGRKLRKERPPRRRPAGDRPTQRPEVRRALYTHTAVLALLSAYVILYAAAPNSLAWSMLLFPSWVRWLGVVLSVAGLFGLVAVHRALGRYWSWDLRIQEGHQLVTSGVYRRVRHPMYTTLIAHMAGLALLSASWLFLLLSAFRIVLFYRRIDREEAILIRHFGDQYRDYMNHTGRLFPRFRQRSAA
jgi:protein-S-isoprenylcysteine O-methyltransferase Ste14